MFPVTHMLTLSWLGEARPFPVNYSGILFHIGNHREQNYGNDTKPMDLGVVESLLCSL